jgi:FemAB-related protein (PEP-CTERM system-associated)
MTVTITTLDQVSAPRWDAYVASRPEATFFHRAGWSRVIEDSFGQRTHYLAALRDGAVAGVLPLAHYKSRLFGSALIANGCCVAGGPVADDEEAHQALDAAAVALMEDLRADYLEYRQPSRRHPLWQARDDLYANFESPIAADEAANFQQIPRKQRAVIRRAMAKDLMDEADPGIERFYPLYSASVRDFGTPVFPRRYFRNLLAVFGPDCDIVTTTWKGQAVASVLNFYFRDRVIPYYTGAARVARTLGAADFLYWRLMRRAVARGCAVFDFGRSKVGTGAWNFKRNWGFPPRPLVHEYRTRDGAPLPAVNPTNPRYRLLIDLWKRLPLPVANFVGPMVVRNIG